MTQTILERMFNELKTFVRIYERDNIFENHFDRPMGSGARVYVVHSQIERIRQIFADAEGNKYGLLPGDWVPVTDYLPDDGDHVWVHAIHKPEGVKAGVRVYREAWIYNHYWWDRDDASPLCPEIEHGSPWLYRVTHWGLLPESPANT